ncbi:MAG: DUF362 domain-containing protein [Armatimonadetes bacterium]|nr:DUF362 domain-containing protein [Armatimonadota bacterium]
MSKVYFASAKMSALRADASLPAKFRRALAHFPLKAMFEGKTIAIKMHLGFNIGYTTIPPIFVRTLIQEIKEAGGMPFVTDGRGAVPGAKARGYTEETLGARLVEAAGHNERYFVNAPIGYLSLENVQICGEIANADAMVVLSHGKGHGQCGWGGAIKNVAMGCVTHKSRCDIHVLIDTEFEWNTDLCVHCYLCRENCPTGAVSFNKEDKLRINLHHCRYCMHCVNCCPHNAIKINEEGIRQFQAGMARVTKACLDTFERGRILFINHVCSVTPFCDCWGFSSPAIVPDVGIFLSEDIVAVEQASIDSVRIENYIPGSLPPPLEIRDVPGHLFEKIHGKDPYLQVEEAAKIGLGSREYEIVEVE